VGTSLEQIMSRTAVGVLVAFAAIGCASSLHVRTDYDPAINFKQFQTYSWHDGTPAKDPFTDKKIVAAIDRQMQTKGFRKVEAGGDLTITYHASTGQHVDLNTVYTTTSWGPYGWGRYGPYGRYWYGRPWGYSGYTTATTSSDTVTTGTVIVDMIDGKTHQLVWRGIGSDELNGDPKDLDKAINAGAAKLFKDFPPNAKST
jgi:hypothetical protein